MTLSTFVKGITFWSVWGRTESSLANNNQLCLGLSNNSGAQREPHCLSQKAKRGPPKVCQSGLRLLQGTGDFKGHIPVPPCIRHQDTVTTATAAGLCCLFWWDDTEPPIPFITENRKGRPRPRKGRKGKKQGIPRCWPPSREALWETPSAWRIRQEASA